MLKRFLTLTIISLLAIMILQGCSSTQNTSSNNPSTNSSNTESQTSESAESFPNKAITLIISYDAGGGTDVGARILAPYVEEELGVPITIVNKPGGGGWIGWTELAEATPDGYTIGYINSPNIITGYLDPKLNRKHNLESFEPIVNHVLDPGILAVRADDTRFETIQDLIEYAKENEVTATSTGVGSNDHYAILNLNETYGTKITPVHTSGGGESAQQILGGHVDIFIAKVGESLNMHNNNEIRILAVMEKERSTFLPDVPTLEESGYPGIYSRSSRGIAAPVGVDPERIEIIRKAFEKGIKNQEHIEKMSEMGLQVEYKEGDDYLNTLKEDEELIKTLMPLLDN